MAHSAPRAALAADASSRTAPTHVRNSLAESGRPLVPFDQALTAINDVGAGLQGLCELLKLANGQPVEPSGLLALLKPLAERLDAASCDLNDMEIVDLSEITKS